MINFEFEAIGTHWFIETYDEIDPNDFEILKEKVIACCRDFEHKYSRFKDESILSKLNREKLLQNPSVEFLDLITLGNDAKMITDGHFDITVATVLENLGYDKDYSFKEKNQKVEKDLEFSSKEIKLSKNSKIDLGGVGKGFLIDKVSDLLKEEGVKYFFINAGGDIFATSNYDKPIEFVLENPFDTTEMIGTIEIMNKSIASSSSNRRRWKDKKTGKENHHLIDMKDEKNIDTVAGVYIEAPTATAADIASTCIFISPKEDYKRISDFYNAEFLVVFNDQSFIRSDKYNGKL